MFKSGGRIFSRARPIHEPKKTVIGQCVPKAVARNWPRLPATRYLALFLYVISCSKLTAKKKGRAEETRASSRTNSCRCLQCFMTRRSNARWRWTETEGRKENESYTVMNSSTRKPPTLGWTLLSFPSVVRALWCTGAKKGLNFLVRIQTP